MQKLKTILWENSLSITLFALFLIFLGGQAITGHQHNNEELLSHGKQAISLPAYIASGDFVESVFENWESEFLQMGALVVLTIFLRQKGSADSKKLRGKEPEDTKSRMSIIHGATLRGKGRAATHMLYRNSLSVALFLLFIMSFVLHALGGAAAYNEEALQHGEQTLSTLSYVATSQFWFESFQNWQSEFLAVGCLLVLSVSLRQQGSPESKPVGEPNKRTGSG
jgi:hypothetical protein